MALPRPLLALRLLLALPLLAACDGALPTPGAPGAALPTPRPASEGSPAPGPPGGLAALDAATGQPLGPWPQVDDRVHAVAPDGAGGWYVGGIFTEIGGALRPNLARLGPDGALDPAWSPAPTGWVWGLAAGDGRVYVCGSDPGADGPDLISALDGATGATLWSVPTDARQQHLICPLLAAGDRLYVGGAFGTIGGEARGGLAALEAATGAVLPWSPPLGLGAGGAVGALALTEAGLYVGGSALEAGGAARGFLALVDPAGGGAQAWDVPGSRFVGALAPAGALLYVGGQAEGGGGVLLAVDSRSGAPAPWSPGVELGGGDGVAALLLLGGALYVGGDFPAAAGQPGPGLVALDAAGGGVLPWGPALRGRDPTPPLVFALAGEGGRVVVGGAFAPPGG